MLTLFLQKMYSLALWIKHQNLDVITILSFLPIMLIVYTYETISEEAYLLKYKLRQKIK